MLLLLLYWSTASPSYLKKNVWSPLLLTHFHTGLCIHVYMHNKFLCVGVFKSSFDKTVDCGKGMNYFVYR